MESATPNSNSSDKLIYVVIIVAILSVGFFVVITWARHNFTDGKLYESSIYKSEIADKVFSATGNKLPLNSINIKVYYSGGITGGGIFTCFETTPEDGIAFVKKYGDKPKKGKYDIPLEVPEEVRSWWRFTSGHFVGADIKGKNPNAGGIFVGFDEKTQTVYCCKW